MLSPRRAARLAQPLVAKPLNNEPPRSTMACTHGSTKRDRRRRTMPGIHPGVLIYVWRLLGRESQTPKVPSPETQTYLSNHTERAGPRTNSIAPLIEPCTDLFCCSRRCPPRALTRLINLPDRKTAFLTDRVRIRHNARTLTARDTLTTLALGLSRCMQAQSKASLRICQPIGTAPNDALLTTRAYLPARRGCVRRVASGDATAL